MALVLQLYLQCCCHCEYAAVSLDYYKKKTGGKGMTGELEENVRKEREGTR